MEGIIIVNKPIDWTSFDVVAKIRNLAKVRKVGHSGTLDPMATGVLPIFLGRATKSIEQFLVGDKGYLAELTLGIKTDTLDARGKVLSKTSNFKFQTSKFEDLLHKYRGEIEQIPPMYSAVKIKGKRLYELARKGVTVERKPRKVTIHKLEVINFKEADFPRVTIEVQCSKGTYVRQLVSDLGDDLGCGAHLSKLVRTIAQPFHLSQAISMETIITLAQVGRLDSIVLPVEEILKARSRAS